MRDVKHVEFTHPRTLVKTIFEFCQKGGVGTLRNLNTGDGFSAANQIWSIMRTYLEREPRLVVVLGTDQYDWTRVGGDVHIEYTNVPKRKFVIPFPVLKSILEEMVETLPV